MGILEYLKSKDNVQFIDCNEGFNEKSITFRFIRLSLVRAVMTIDELKKFVDRDDKLFIISNLTFKDDKISIMYYEALNDGIKSFDPNKYIDYQTLTNQIDFEVKSIGFNVNLEELMDSPYFHFYVHKIKENIYSKFKVKEGYIESERSYE